MDNILFIVLHFTVSLFQCLVAFPTNHGNVTNCTIHVSISSVARMNDFYAHLGTVLNKCA